jgi:membrane dipeptidase
MTSPSAEALRTAGRIHADLPVFDGHNDLPWALRLHAGSDLERADPNGPLPDYHTDIPRLLQGGVGAQFWSVYVPADSTRPFETTLEQIDLVDRLIEHSGGVLVKATTAGEVSAARREGKVASLLGAEGGHSIEDSLDKLQTLFARGVRYMTLTHGDSLDWADSATDRPRCGGLSPFGEEVVREMNRLGMLVDISHVSAEAMRHVLEITEVPVIASHSSAFALAPHPRNVPDDVLAGVAANGGVVMVNFYPAFVVESSAVEAASTLDEERELRARFGEGQELAYEQAMRERHAAHPMDRGTTADVADHIEHIADIAGVDHVGLGSDFDGIEVTPVGLEDVSCFPAITAELIDRGWDEVDIRKVLGDNALRVLAAAAAAAS